MSCQMELHFKFSGKAESTKEAAERLLCWSLIGRSGEERKRSMSRSYMQTEVQL